jgi:3-dehydroquinate synthase
MNAPVRSRDPITVNVGLGARAYDIAIGRGLLATLGERVAKLRPGCKVAIVTDETVARHHLAAAQASLKAAGVHAASVRVPAGEGSKSFAMLERVIDALLAAKVERGDVVVALGGGVIGDLAGFAASVLRRGVDYVQVPTTLLAQVDSSVGGKTAVNAKRGKNLIGAFYQPILVLADTALLDTLAEREFRAGYAEVVKYGLLGDRHFFEWLEEHWKDVFAGAPARGNAPAPREYAVLQSVQAKAGIVAQDERETGDRMLLNLGHTFGHAFEAAAGFSDRLLHGEAIGLGMALAFEFSARRGLLPKPEAERAIAHLAAVGLPTDVDAIPGERPGVDAIMDLISQDKKVRRGRLTFILARRSSSAMSKPTKSARFWRRSSPHEYGRLRRSI